MFGLKGDLDYFFSECREVISVPEKHQDEKGREGKLNFQVYFHDVPASLEAINDTALVVLALDGVQCRLPQERKSTFSIPNCPNRRRVYSINKIEQNEFIK